MGSPKQSGRVDGTAAIDHAGVDHRRNRDAASHPASARRMAATTPRLRGAWHAALSACAVACVLATGCAQAPVAGATAQATPMAAVDGATAAGPVATFIATPATQRLIGDVARLHAATLAAAGEAAAVAGCYATATAIAGLAARTRARLAQALASGSATDHAAIAAANRWAESAPARALADAERSGVGAAAAKGVPAAASDLAARAPLYVRLLDEDGAIAANRLALESAHALRRRDGDSATPEFDAQAVRNTASLLYARVYAAVPLPALVAAAEHVQSAPARRARDLLLEALAGALPAWIEAVGKSTQQACGNDAAAGDVAAPSAH